MLHLPASYIKRVVTTCGPAGALWLESLDRRVAFLAAHWELSHFVIFPKLSYCLVARAQSPRGSVVLKLSYDKVGIRREWLALSAYAGSGAVRVFDANLDQGALLLEDLEPGNSLQNYDDEKATFYAAGLMKQLMIPLEELEKADQYPHMREWFAALFENRPEIPRDSLSTARRWLQELLEDNQSSFLSHGDLHHGNILQSKRGWIAIDPKGVRAPYGFDVGAFMRNPFPELLDNPRRTTLIGRRFEQFTELLDADEDYLVRMSYCQAILSVCWALEEGSSDWKKWLECAMLIKDH